MAFVGVKERRKITDLWLSPNTYATSLLALALDEYGTDVMAWEPETFRLELHNTYRINPLPMNMDKFLGLRSALASNVPYFDVMSFNALTLATNNRPVLFSVFSPVLAHEAAWTLQELFLNDPPDKVDEFKTRFSPDVLRYLGLLCEEAGIHIPSGLLAIAEIPPTRPEDTFEDPDLLSAYLKAGQEVNIDVAQYVVSRFSDLVSELDGLPLQNRDQKVWQRTVEKLQSNISRASL